MMLRVQFKTRRPIHIEVLNSALRGGDINRQYRHDCRKLGSDVYTAFLREVCDNIDAPYLTRNTVKEILFMIISGRGNVWRGSSYLKSRLGDSQDTVNDFLEFFDELYNRDYLETVSSVAIIDLQTRFNSHVLTSIVNWNPYHETVIGDFQVTKLVKNDPSSISSAENRFTSALREAKRGTIFDGKQLQITIQVVEVIPED